MSRARGTDGSLLASLPWTLVALGFAILPHLPFLPIWITATLVACALWRYSIEMRRKPIPHTLVRAALALACFLGVLAAYRTISGVGPGSALLSVMAALKLLETRQRRDQFVLLFIAIFLVMSSLLREQYIWSLPYLLVAVAMIMTAWLRMSAEDSDPLQFSIRSSGRLLLYALPIALAMWVFFPRISTPFWSVPIDTGSAVSGLSDTMSPGRYQLPVQVGCRRLPRQVRNARTTAATTLLAGPRPAPLRRPGLERHRRTDHGGRRATPPEFQR